MAARRGHLTAKERTFAAKMAATGDAVYAAEKAGYSSPRQSASKNLQNPDILNDIHAITEKLLSDRLVPLANARMERVLADDAQKGSVHVAAVKLVWEYGLRRGGPTDKDMAEMTASELRLVQQATQRQIDELDAKALTIDHVEAAPNEPDPGIFG